MDSEFSLIVDGQETDIRSLICHFHQESGFGGVRYELTIIDPDILGEAKRKFGLGVRRDIAPSDQMQFLSYLFPLIGLKCGRGEAAFWANTIVEADIRENVLTLKGQGSHQQK